MRLEAWADSHIGLVRKNNQDAFGCFLEADLFIVADGMGGRSEGEVASTLAVETVRAVLSPKAEREDRPFHRWRLWTTSPSSPPTADGDLRRAIASANERIYITGHEQPSHDMELRGSMGTTVITLTIDLERRIATWAYVGDSRLYRVRDGAAALLTADHTIPGEPFWTQANIPIDLPHTNRLIRALGIAPTVEVTTGGDAARAGDLYLLCSDGVSGMVPPDVLTRCLLSTDTIESIGQSLIRHALDSGGRDNATALLVRVHED
jgi:protein phosphatase